MVPQLLRTMNRFVLLLPAMAASFSHRRARYTLFGAFNNNRVVCRRHDLGPAVRRL
jgi:hypothetical protein